MIQMMTKSHATKEISILSWNIHDNADSNEGLKSEHNDFADILKCNTIFCLQETKQDISFSNYRCFNSLRKYSRSGGLCKGVHRSLEDMIKHIKIDSPDVQVKSLRLQTGPSKKYLSIINVYDSPEYGAYKIRKKNTSTEEYIPTLEQLVEFMATKNDLEKIRLTGDFNARTSSENHETDHSNESEVNFDW